MRFRLRHGSAIELLQDGLLLFSESEQQLTHLGGSAPLLADRLREGATQDQLVSSLRELGVDHADSSEWVDGFLVALSRLAVLEGERSGDPAPPTAEQILSLPGRTIAIVYETDELLQEVGSAYAHLAVGQGTPQTRFRLWAEKGFVWIGRDGHGAIAVEPPLAAVRLKGMILEEILQEGDQLFALHAASLRHRDANLLLLGPPGAGKTTLALTLAARGWDFGSDDVTLVFNGGQVLGIPLAAGVKESAWNLLLSKEARKSLPAHQRPDGQLVRFLPVDAPASAPAGVSTIVRLQRSSGQEPFLKPLPATEIVAQLLAESRSPSGKCSTDIFTSLVELARSADAFELHYSDADGAAGLLMERVVHE